MKVHINIPRGYYIGQVRPTGGKRWRTCTGRCKSAESALSRAVAKMQGMHRARALFVDASGWYGASVAIEASR